MSYLQHIVDNFSTYNTMVLGDERAPKDFKNDKDRFIYLAKEALRLQTEGKINDIPENEVALIDSRFFVEAVYSCNGLYEIALYVIKKMKDRKKISFGQDQVKVFEKQQPETPEKRQRERSPRSYNLKYIDLERFLRTNEVLYIEESDDYDGYSFFFVTKDGHVTEISNYNDTEDHTGCYLVAYPTGPYSVRDMENYIENLIRNSVVFSGQNSANSKFNLYMKAFPMHTVNSEDDDEFLDLNLFLTTGKVSYFNSDIYHKNDNFNFFYMLHDCKLIDRDDLGLFGDYGGALIFAYPKPAFYTNEGEYNKDEYHRSIIKLLDDYVNSFESAL